MTSDPETAPDCRACGACCTTGNRGPALLAIGRAEYRRLPATAVLKAPTAGGSVYSLRFDPSGRCSSLDGVIGFAVNCGVYNDRPNVCRALRHDSPECHAARALLGMQ